MTTREQLIERIVRAVIEDDIRHGIATPDEDLDRRCPWYRSNAHAALDAIQPIVTTVDQLAALPVGSLLVDLSGDSWAIVGSRRALPTMYMGTIRIEQLADYGPLVVVWQPSDGAT